MYVYIHTYIRTCIHACRHAYLHTHICAYMYVQTYIRPRTQACKTHTKLTHVHIRRDTHFFQIKNQSHDTKIFKFDIFLPHGVHIPPSFLLPSLKQPGIDYPIPTADQVISRAIPCTHRQCAYIYTYRNRAWTTQFLW